MEFLQKNARSIVIALLVVGVVTAFFVGSNDSNNNNDSDVKTTDTSEVVATSTTGEKGTTQSNSDTKAITTESIVSKSDNSFSISTVEGDNQTVNVRKVMQSFIRETGEKVSEEQSLFIETTLVDTLPRNDLIYAGNVIVLDGSQIQSVFDAAHQLTDFQISLWAQYL